jgi:hypothetical protein
LSAGLEALWKDVRDGDPDRPHFVLSARAAMYLHALHEDGAPLFPHVGPMGGTIATVPAVINAAAGNKLILIDAAHIAVSDDGLLVDVANAASVALDDAPSSPASLTSVWQSNTSFIRMTRLINWTTTADDAVGVIELPLDGSPA